MLSVKFLPGIPDNCNPAQIEDALNSCDVNLIRHSNWEEYPYVPFTGFRIGYNRDLLYLKYTVSEDCIRAKYSNDFEEVWNDSCVEFFIAPGTTPDYYNFEFNCIGTGLLAYGPSRNNRIKAPSSLLQKVFRYSSLGNAPFQTRCGNFQWELLLVIPAETFFNHSIDSFSGRTMRANFYKCGNELETPHYVSWNPVLTETPNFHTPNDFGFIRFEESR